MTSCQLIITLLKDKDCRITKKMLLHIVYIYKMILPRFKTFNRVKNQFCTFRSS